MITLDRKKLELEENWEELSMFMPQLVFNSRWAIRIMPPVNGAYVHFVASTITNAVSVRLVRNVVDEKTDFSRHFYWETCDKAGSRCRVPMRNADMLMDIIKAALGE